MKPNQLYKGEVEGDVNARQLELPLTLTRAWGYAWLGIRLIRRSRGDTAHSFRQAKRFGLVSMPL